MGRGVIHEIFSLGLWLLVCKVKLFGVMFKQFGFYSGLECVVFKLDIPSVLVLSTTAEGQLQKYEYGRLN